MNLPTVPPSRRGAFTLIELLLVIAILGVVTAVVVPQFGAGMSGARLTIGARTVIQAARYARTMALLHQAETVLVLGLGSGTVRVEAAPAGGENAAVGTGEAAAAGDPLGAVALAPEDPDAAAADDARSATNRPVAAMTAQAFADELEAEYQCEGVQFRFLGFADQLADGEPARPGSPAALDDLSDPAATARVLYRSNGTCRPFRVRVLRDEEEWLDVVFDMTGGGRVVEP